MCGVNCNVSIDIWIYLLFTMVFICILLFCKKLWVQ